MQENYRGLKQNKFNPISGNSQEMFQHNAKIEIKKAVKDLESKNPKKVEKAKKLLAKYISINKKESEERSEQCHQENS